MVIGSCSGGGRVRIIGGLSFREGFGGLTFARAYFRGEGVALVIGILWYGVIRNIFLQAQTKLFDKLRPNLSPASVCLFVALLSELFAFAPNVLFLVRDVLERNQNCPRNGDKHANSFSALGTDHQKSDGGEGGNQKKIHARENVRKKNSCTR